MTDPIEALEAQVATLTAQRDKLLELGKDAHVALPRYHPVRKRLYDAIREIESAVEKT